MECPPEVAVWAGEGAWLLDLQKMRQTGCLHLQLFCPFLTHLSVCLFLVYQPFPVEKGPLEKNYHQPYCYSYLHAAELFQKSFKDFFFSKIFFKISERQKKKIVLAVEDQCHVSELTKQLLLLLASLKHLHFPHMPQPKESFLQATLFIATQPGLFWLQEMVVTMLVHLPPW